MNLVRLGHYHTPQLNGDGTCQAALVVQVIPDGGSPSGIVVNLVVWQHDGEQERHLFVPVVPPVATASFHLALECPYGR